MKGRFVAALVLALTAFGFAVADEFQAIITNVKDGRTAVGPHRVDGELPAAEQPGPQQPNQEPLVLVQVVELARAGGEAPTHPLGRC